MTMPRLITSRDNVLLQRVRKLLHDPTHYRKTQALWLEGEHLCDALRVRGATARHAICAESAHQRKVIAMLASHAEDQILVPDRLFADLSSMPSPAGIGFLCDLPPTPPLDTGVATVVMDRLQDAGNVGSILRSAAALGVGQVISMRGTAGLWSPKVMRAGMGAHFGLRLIEGLDIADLDSLAVPLVATSSHGATALQDAPLPEPCGWIFGHEGQGVSEHLLERCSLTVRIPQPGGEESLNVAAAAAICLYESSRRRQSPGQ